MREVILAATMKVREWVRKNEILLQSVLPETADIKDTNMITKVV